RALAAKQPSGHHHRITSAGRPGRLRTVSRKRGSTRVARSVCGGRRHGEVIDQPRHGAFDELDLAPEPPQVTRALWIDLLLDRDRPDFGLVPGEPDAQELAVVGDARGAPGLVAVRVPLQRDAEVPA